VVDEVWQGRAVSPDGSPLIDVGHFDAVDRSASPGQFAAWMDHQRAQAADRAFAPLSIESGEAVLDIGCGTGVDLDAVAGLTQRATGVDLSRTMARKAKERASHGRFSVAVADGQWLPFRTASFDAACCRAVLIHTPTPSRAVAELRRVLKPGGRAVLLEPDHGSHLVATTEQDVFERLLRHRRQTFLNPLVGRSLPALATEAGLEVSSCHVFPIVHRSLATALAAGGPFGKAVEAAVADGAITPAEAERYLASLEASDENGTFLFAAASVMVTIKR